MEQNALHLIVLVGAFLVVMALPIVIGVIAVLADREDT
jgi:hypothetical protein